MKKLLLLMLLASPSFALGLYSAWCEDGNQRIRVSGTTYNTQVSYPACTVTVFNSNGSTLASIFSDSIGTPKANPFNLTNSNGRYSFYANSGFYVLRFSGSGIGTPFTIPIFVADLGGGGGGNGILSIDGLTAPLQFLQIGTAGTDFNLFSASGNTHVFNLPTASATNRGALSPSDWTLFNSKQPALTFSPPLLNTGGIVSIVLPMTIGQGGTGQVTKTPAFNALSPLTTKGDVLAFNGTDNIRFAVGPDGQCFTADSTQPSGFRWMACSVAAGTVTNVGTSAPLTGGPITNTGTIGCPTCGVTTSPLSQFSSTSSAQLLGIMSDASGTGFLVFNNSPTILTPFIASFVNANHNHSNAAGGGQLTVTAIATGSLEGNGSKLQLFTGVNPTANDCAKFDANFNIVTAGGPCGTSGGTISALTGDVSASGAGSVVATVNNLGSGVTMAGYLAATAIAAPGSPSAGTGRIYVDSTSKNLSVKDDAGVVKHGVQTQAGAANNFATAVSDAGVVTIAQPTILNLVSFSSANFLSKVTDPSGTGVVMGNNTPTILTPTIASFVNANHNHTNAAGGGQLAEAALALTNVTTNNATTSAHGFLPILTGSTADCLLGNGTFGSCSGAGGGANTTLSNLGATNINAALLYQTGIDDGSTAKPIRNIFFFGSGTYGTTSMELTGTPTASRVWTFQDSTDTVVGRNTTDTLTNKTLTSPVMTTPTLGVATATSINGNTITAGTGTLTLGAVTLNAGAGGTLGSNAFTSTAFAIAARLINTTAPLTGGGNLTADRTLACPTCTTNASALTANLPMIGAGGQAAAVGTVTGNTTEFATWTGATTAGRCVDTDASGNLKITALDCAQGTSVTLTTVSSSATPTFVRSTQIQEWFITLNTNVTSSTTSGVVAADIMVFNICQDATGGRTFVWPTGFGQAVTISGTANGCTKQTFYWSGTAAIAITPGVSTDSKFVNPPTAMDPGCTTGADLGGQWMDSTSAVTTHFKVCANVASTPTWVQVF